MLDTWSDYSGCWADVYDDDHEEMQACEANPDPESTLGPCGYHFQTLISSIIFAVTFFGRQPQPQPKSVVELLMTGSKPSTATSARRPKPDAALGRYLDAQRARETQAALAGQFAGEYARALEGANSQERYAAAMAIAEAYEEARSLTQIELDLMVAAKVIGVSDCTERHMDIQDSSEGDEIFGLPGDYVRAAAHWRYVAEIEQAIHLQETRGNLWGADSVLAVADDRIEADILDSIIAEGSCRACGTRWASVLGLNGDRAVKIEDGCPNEVCVLGDR